MSEVIVEVILPKFGRMQEATITGWLKGEGGRIEEDEPLFSIETDKASQEVKSPASGFLQKILVAEGETVEVGTVIGLIAIPQEVLTPREKAFLSATPPPGPSIPLPLKRIPLTGMRRAIAERMAASLRESAQYTTTMEMDVTQAAVLRSAKVSPTSIVVKLVARALGEHPLLNSAIVEDEIVIWDRKNIGVAVSTGESGLIVPVVYEAEQKSVEQISTIIDELAAKARSHRLTEDELSYGTFTVTNLGMYGIDAFTPILDPPQVAILGVGRWIEKPVAVKGEITVRTMSVFSLTTDHRVVNGAQSAAFLKSCAEHLVNSDFI